MDYREIAFKAKLADAASQLGVPVEQIVSMKVRENVGGYREYQELLDALQREAGLDHSPVDGKFQGNGHLVGNAKTKVIVVEHETGLEILYIAGSVASIISLVPLVLRCWQAIRGHLHRPHHPDFHALEIRRIDSSGRLVEERDRGMGLPWSESLDVMSQALLSAAENIDGEMRRMKAAIESLADRLDAVEKKQARKGPRRATKEKKAKTKKRKKPKA